MNHAVAGEKRLLQEGEHLVIDMFRQVHAGDLGTMSPDNALVITLGADRAATPVADRSRLDTVASESLALFTTRPKGYTQLGGVAERITDRRPRPFAEANPGTERVRR